MPSGYAHYRFGKAAKTVLPESAAKAVKHVTALYNAGLQGPDPFFYNNLLKWDKISAYGSQLHHQTGREFFSRMVTLLRRSPSEGGNAFLFGLLGHYALDSMCHPFVCRIADQGTIGHTQLETEFDRFLLTRDGKVPACTQCLSPKFHLSRGEILTAAQFFPEVSRRTVRRSYRNMELANRVLAVKNRKLLGKAFHLAGDKASQMVMTLQPDTACAHLDGTLLELYEKALERYPVLARQLQAHLDSNTPLGEEFEPIFG